MRILGFQIREVWFAGLRPGDADAGYLVPRQGEKALKKDIAVLCAPKAFFFGTEGICPGLSPEKKFPGSPVRH